MTIVIDTHVHIYPFYDIADALSATLANLSTLSKSAVKIACLTEGGECNVYDAIASGEYSEVEAVFAVTQQPDSLLLQHKEIDGQAGAFHLLPGQQVVTAENIEILSLSCKNRVAQQQPARETVGKIRDAGGVPVVAWGLGKWLGSRGKVVRDLLDHFGPEELAVGDTSMRPRFCWPSSVIARARRLGYRILCGSDPLPVLGEESQPGTYATKIHLNAGAGFNPADFAHQLLIEDWVGQTAGHRGLPSTVFFRQLRQSKSKNKY